MTKTTASIKSNMAFFANLYSLRQPKAVYPPSGYKLKNEQQFTPKGCLWHKNN